MLLNKIEQKFSLTPPLDNVDKFPNIICLRCGMDDELDYSFNCGPSSFRTNEIGEGCGLKPFFSEIFADHRQPTNYSIYLFSPSLK